MSESDRLFGMLEPPPGGLQRLQRHLAAARPPRHRRELQLAAAFALSVLIVGGLWLPGVLTRHRRNSELAHALRQAMAPPATGMQVFDGAAIELPSGQSNVRVYLVQTAAPAVSAGRN